MEMYKIERLLQREDSDVSLASNGVNLKVCVTMLHSV